MPTEPQDQDGAEDRPQPAFGSRRHAVLDKNGQTLRGFTKQEYHEREWTPERREEQRQKMLALHAAGKAGGQNGFHKRRTKKAQEILAERFQEEAETVWDKLKAMIDQPKDKRLQLEAIRELARFEDWATKNAREDEREFKKLSGQELDSRLLGLMGEALGIDFGAFTEAFAQPISDADVVEDGHELEAGETYDPTNSELGGDRLRAGAEIAQCEDCQEERDRVVELLRDSGVEDDELISITAARARCEDHRESTY